MGHPWHQLPAWRVLDTDFGFGQTFLSTWNAWQQDAGRPRTLHYVALCERPCVSQDLIASCATKPALVTLARELAAQWFGLLPGFHRFLLARGQVVLTLCVGEPLGMLRAQQFEADAVELCTAQRVSADPSWFLKALARCCRRGTALSLRGLHDASSADEAALRATLVQSGFTFSSNDTPPDNLMSRILRCPQCHR